MLFVSACGDDPVAPLFDVQDVSVNVMEDTPLSVTVPVAANHAVTAMITGQPTHGTITASPDNRTFTYTPAKDYNGPDSVAVTFTSGTDSKVGTAHITVTPVDDAPVANPDNFAAPFQTVTMFAQSALLANDTDVDNTNLTVMSVTAVTHGQVAMAGTDVQFTPESAYQGIATFAYTVTDGTLTATGQVTVTIGNNSPPVAVADTVAGTEDTALMITNATLLANDTDADHQTLTVIAVTNGTHGTVAQVPGGVSFIPDPNFNGVAGFSYTITDGADTSSATVTINMAGVADPPVTAPDALTTAEDVALNIPFATLTGNDTDVDGHALTISAVTGATHGTVALGAGNTVVFTPALNYNGPAAFDYTASDGTAMATGHVSVTVTPVDDPPVAVDDNISGNEDSVITVTTATLLANDLEVDGETLTFVGVGNPSNGTVAVNAGTVSYTPNANFNGAATFKYTITDGHTNATGTVHVTVANVNDLPIAVNDAIATVEHVDGSVNALANDSDIDGDTLTITSVTNGMNGTATFAGAVVTYHPGVNFSGTDSFTYTISDGHGGMATATITVNVANSNDPPSVANDTVVTNEDTAISFNPTLNDVDPNGGPLTLASFGQPGHGVATSTGNVITYTPSKDFNGADSILYAVSDQTGGMSTGTISISVIPVDDPPIANNESYSIDEDTALVVSAANGVLANDTDIDSPVLNAILVTNALNGTLVLNSDGSFFYQGAADYNGPDSFTYRAFDGSLVSNAITVQITVNAVNDAPIARDDQYDIGVNGGISTFDCGSSSSKVVIGGHGAKPKAARTYQPSTPVAAKPATAPKAAVAKTATTNRVTSKQAATVIQPLSTCGVLANDSDAEDVPLTQTVTMISGPAHGTFDTALDANGEFEYTPDQDYSGLDTFTYIVTDSDGDDSNVATVKIIVHPTATDDSFAGEFFFGQGSGSGSGNTGEISGNVITGQGDGSGSNVPDTGNAAGNMIAILDNDGTGAQTQETDGGGKVTLQPSGDFVYEAPAAGLCEDFVNVDVATGRAASSSFRGASSRSAASSSRSGAILTGVRAHTVNSSFLKRALAAQPPGGGQQDGQNECFIECFDQFYYYDDSGNGATSLTNSPTWFGSGNGDGFSAGDNEVDLELDYFFGFGCGFDAKPQSSASSAPKVDLSSQ